MSSAAGMITSVKNNLKLKSKRKSYFDSKNGSHDAVPTEFDFPEVSQEKLDRIKKNIQEKARKERVIYNLVALALSVLVVLILIWTF